MPTVVLRQLVGLDHPVLRRKAKKVGKVDGSIRQLVDDLVETMRAAPGVGLAAPQVGISLRVAVVEVEKKLHVLINPEIVERSEETHTGPEACLSIPGYWAEITRAKRVKVRALDRRGRRYSVAGEDLVARALQHEVDHLDGILYIDRLPSLDLLRRVEELEAEEQREVVTAG